MNDKTPKPQSLKQAFVFTEEMKEALKKMYGSAELTQSLQALAIKQIEKAVLAGLGFPKPEHIEAVYLDGQKIEGLLGFAPFMVGGFTPSDPIPYQEMEWMTQLMWFKRALLAPVHQPYRWPVITAEGSFFPPCV